MTLDLVAGAVLEGVLVLDFVKAMLVAASVVAGGATRAWTDLQSPLLVVAAAEVAKIYETVRYFD